METSPKVLGARGEDAACRWYVDNGYRIIARNWRITAGEIDLIVETDGLVVFCEVKTRSSVRWGLPAEAVHRTKQQRIRRLAAAWLEQNTGHHRVRFDVASVISGRVTVIEAAF